MRRRMLLSNSACARRSKIVYVNTAANRIRGSTYSPSRSSLSYTQGNTTWCLSGPSSVSLSSSPFIVFQSCDSQMFPVNINEDAVRRNNFRYGTPLFMGIQNEDEMMLDWSRVLILFFLPHKKPPYQGTNRSMKWSTKGERMDMGGRTLVNLCQVLSMMPSTNEV